jgi:hypothetical protein
MSRLLAVLMLFAAAPLAAQVDLTARIAAVHHGAHAGADEIVDAPRLRPGDGFEPAVGVGLTRGQWRLALAGSRQQADVVLRGDGSGILTVDALRATTVVAELARWLDLGAGRLLVGLGVGGTRWSFPGLGDPARWRWAIGASVEGVLPIGSGWAAVSRVAASRGEGLFTDDELPDGYDRRTPLRLEIGTGIRWHP